jgi:hypothetical protein
MALWCGVNYVNGCAGQPDPYPFLAPGLAGALQGLAQGLLFDLVVILDFPTASPRETLMSLAIMLVMTLAGILVCALLGMLSAWLRLRSYPREEPPQEP